MFIAKAVITAALTLPSAPGRHRSKSPHSMHFFPLTALPPTPVGAEDTEGEGLTLDPTRRVHLDPECGVAPASVLYRHRFISS